jgi:glycosyltransferase involved in cell wall biosynthesis
MPPHVALTMIVKNEEANLPACLASARDLVDEIVVDTGSTDRTCQFAARNESLPTPPPTGSSGSTPTAAAERTLMDLLRLQPNNPTAPANLAVARRALARPRH